MRKIWLCLGCLLLLCGCSLFEKPFNQDNCIDLFYMYEKYGPRQSFLRISVDKETKNKIGRLQITGYLSEKIIDTYAPEQKDELLPLIDTAVAIYEEDAIRIKGHKNFMDTIKKDNPEKRSFYASFVQDYTNSDEVDTTINFTYNFEFWNEDFDIKDKTTRDLLERFGLLEIYDEDKGELRLDDLKKSKNFTYRYLFNGEFDEVTDFQN